MHAGRNLGVGVDDPVHVPGAERPSTSDPESGLLQRRCIIELSRRLQQLALHHGERTARAAVVVEVDALMRVPADQPDVEARVVDSRRNQRSSGWCCASARQVAASRPRPRAMASSRDGGKGGSVGQVRFGGDLRHGPGSSRSGCGRRGLTRKQRRMHVGRLDGRPLSAFDSARRTTSALPHPRSRWWSWP